MKLYFDFIFVLALFIFNYRNRTIGLFELVGLSIGLLSYSLWIVARIQLGKFFSTLPKAKGLVTRGLYSKIRNPVYVFSTLSVLGAIFPSKNIFQYLLLIIIVFVQMFRLNKEETLLEKKFGSKYSLYKKRTWF